MASTLIRSRIRAAALGALVISLAAGCGAGEQEPAGPADDATEPSTGDVEPNNGSAASDAGGDDSAPSDAGGDGSAAPDAAAGTPLPATADLATEQLPIPAEQAVEIAVDTVGGGQPVSVQIDHDDDVWEWEIEVALDGREHDLDIDATTGEVTQHDQDDDEDPQEPAVDVTAPLPHAEALQLAVGQAPGRVSGWQLDSDDGRIRYQVDVEKSQGEDDAEVEIDVETREVRVDG